MPTPHEENRPLPAARKTQGKPRRVSLRERRRQAFQYWVTVGLAIVFIGTSVGALILVRPPTAPEGPGAGSVDQQRLASSLEQAQKNPTDPQWPFEAGQLYAQQGDLDKAIDQYRNALKIDPGYLPALQQLGNQLLTSKKYPEAHKVLKEGIAAERKDIDNLNKSRKPDDPEVFPDPLLRTMMFAAAISLGPSYRADAQNAVREGLTTNPTMFIQSMQGWALSTAFEENNKEKALTGLSLALNQARALKDPESIDKLEKLMQMVMTLNLTPPSAAPSGAPAPATSGAPGPAASPTGGPAAGPPPQGGGPAPAGQGQPGATAPQGNVPAAR